MAVSENRGALKSEDYLRFSLVELGEAPKQSPSHEGRAKPKSLNKLGDCGSVFSALCCPQDAPKARG